MYTSEKEGECEGQDNGTYDEDLPKYTVEGHYGEMEEEEKKMPPVYKTLLNATSNPVNWKKQKRVDDGDICTVCFEKINNFNGIVYLGCTKHIVHKNCFSTLKHIKFKNNCPKCNKAKLEEIAFQSMRQKIKDEIVRELKDELKNDLKNSYTYEPKPQKPKRSFFGKLKDLIN